MLKQRIITALILLPIALAGFFWLNGWAFALFIGAVIAIGAWEWARLSGLLSQGRRVAYALSVAAILLVLYWLPIQAQTAAWREFFWLANLPLWVLLVACAWWALALLLIITYPNSTPLWRSTSTRLLIGFLVLVPAWQGLVLLKTLFAHEPAFANLMIISIMVLVWGADIGAYFAGRRFGKRKLAPAVSPGKSWEGAIGGWLFSLLLTVIVGLVQGWPAGLFITSLLLATLVVASSIVGDLTESMFKRQAGMKDSSNLLPGHGGVLDRIDSLTAAIPVFTLLLIVFRNLL